jgi:hypothetical protein
VIAVSNYMAGEKSTVSRGSCGWQKRDYQIQVKHLLLESWTNTVKYPHRSADSINVPLV